MTSVPESVAIELASLAPSALIELYQLKLLPGINDGKGPNGQRLDRETILRFHAGTNQLKTKLIFGGLEYDAVPCKIEGFEVTAKGVLPRPTFAVANANSAISAILTAFNPLKAELARVRTCKKFLDPINFTDNTNPTADASAIFSPDASHTSGSADIWYIDRVASENITSVQFELSSKLDLHNVRLPTRQILEFCPWKYKGAQCGYRNENGFYNINDSPCNASQDECGKRYESCIVRFGNEVDLPFGGFPGARLQM